MNRQLQSAREEVGVKRVGSSSGHDLGTDADLVPLISAKESP